MVVDLIFKFSLIVLVCSLFAALYGLISIVMYKLIDIEKNKEKRQIARTRNIIQRYNHSYCTKEYFKNYFKNES